MAKLVASETAEAVFSGALQTLGGYGYLEESSAGIAKICRDVRVCLICEGASNSQRMDCPRTLKGKPMAPDPVVIISYARTPLGGSQGIFASASSIKSISPLPPA